MFSQSCVILSTGSWQGIGPEEGKVQDEGGRVYELQSTPSLDIGPIPTPTPHPHETHTHTHTGTDIQLWLPNHLRLASVRYPLYWNAFLLILIMLTSNLNRLFLFHIKKFEMMMSLFVKFSVFGFKLQIFYNRVFPKLCNLIWLIELI